MPRFINRWEHISFMKTASRTLILVKPSGWDELENGVSEGLLQFNRPGRLSIGAGELVPTVDPHFAEVIDRPEIARLFAMHREAVICQKIQFAQLALDQLELGFGPLSVNDSFPDTLQANL